jgi:hypothetical protein
MNGAWHSAEALLGQPGKANPLDLSPNSEEFDRIPYKVAGSIRA